MATADPPASPGNPLRLRAGILTAIRFFFSGRGYLEVETPVRIPAPAPEAHIDAIPSEDWFLQTSPELCMKRLLAAGFDRIFQICKCFRRGERGNRHLTEFTMLEWYAADSDYRDMMAETAALIRSVAGAAGIGPHLSYQGHRIDLERPWDRLSVAEAFDLYASLSMEEALDAGRFDDVIALEIEPRLGFGRPLFLYDYPAASGSLARLRRDDPTVAERFELYIAGMELCNAFTELTDPVEQRFRFEEEENRRRSAGRTPDPSPEPFLEALSHMPPSSGNALGVDRLAMLLADTGAIDRVVTFTPESL